MSVAVSVKLVKQGDRRFGAVADVGARANREIDIRDIDHAGACRAGQRNNGAG